MSDNEIKQSEIQADTTEQNYINAIADMKKNTVSKSEYDKVLLENKQLLETLVNGNTIETKVEEPKVDINALRKDLFNDDSNINANDFIAKSLQLREEILKREGKDIFVPTGHNYVPTESDFEDAQRTADALQYCLDRADGDSNIFTNELQRILVDTIPPRKSNNRR